MKQGIIYKITSPSGKVYIGYTTKNSIKERYRRGVSQKQRKLYDSVFKYGWDNHEKEIIESLPVELLKEREAYWIEKYNSYYHGLNATIGGDGNTREILDSTRKKISEATKIGLAPLDVRKKISDSNSTRKISLETRKNMSNAQLGKKHPHSEESKNKISEATKEAMKLIDLSNRIYTDETRKKMSESAKGKVYSEEYKKRMSEIMKESIKRRKENG